MTEQEYIDITNLTRIESALAILRRVHGIDYKMEQVLDILYKKQEELNRKITIDSEA